MVDNYGPYSRDIIVDGEVKPNEPILRQQEAENTAAKLAKNMDNSPDVEGETPVKAPPEDVKIIRVENTVYMYITWQDLFDQLEEHWIPVEKIWEICHGIKSEITLEEFYREALEKEALEKEALKKGALKNLGDEKSQLWKHYWNQLISYLRQQDVGSISAEYMWRRCKEMDQRLKRGDFWPIAINDRGFLRNEIEKLQDEVDWPDDKDYRRNWYDF